MMVGKEWSCCFSCK